MKKLCFISILMLYGHQALADNYQMIIDAGSTGSRLHLFQYKKKPALPIINDIFSVSNKIPLSSFADYPEHAGASLAPLFYEAENQLKNNNIPLDKVKVNILATSGMRMISMNKQDKIYKNISDFLKLNYDFRIGKIETITGKRESLYAWLDVNYLAKTFQNHTRSFGAIDMGGGSTQIAFETKDRSKPEDLITFKLNGQSYTVFAKSFSRLGLDQARSQMYLFSHYESCYPTGYDIGKSLGDWNFAQCAAIYKQVINLNHVAEQMIPTVGQNFYAFSGAYYTYHFFDKNTPKTTLDNRIQSICTKPWRELNIDFPQVENKHLAMYCSNAAYINDLFYNTYQLQENQLNFAHRINHHDIDWTLGALLYSLTR